MYSRHFFFSIDFKTCVRLLMLRSYSCTNYLLVSNDKIESVRNKNLYVSATHRNFHTVISAKLSNLMAEKQDSSRRELVGQSENHEIKILSWEDFVDYGQLSEKEKHIHEQHRAAVKKGEKTYKDPETGYTVMTRLAHIERGDCCGNACRHCPFNQRNVKDDLKKKRFNTAFYV